jgi:DNA helicase-2/ATP-dependent DNA helicase PcrA
MTVKGRSDADSYESFQVEDRVKHPKFGEGQILQRSGFGDQTKLLVAFGEEGEKLLLAKYAKLRRVRPIETEEPESTSEDETTE